MCDLRLDLYLYYHPKEWGFIVPDKPGINVTAGQRAAWVTHPTSDHTPHCLTPSLKAAQLSSRPRLPPYPTPYLRPVPLRPWTHKLPLRLQSAGYKRQLSRAATANWCRPSGIWSQHWHWKELLWPKGQHWCMNEVKMTYLAYVLCRDIPDFSVDIIYVCCLHQVIVIDIKLHKLFIKYAKNITICHWTTCGAVYGGKL